MTGAESDGRTTAAAVLPVVVGVGDAEVALVFVAGLVAVAD